MLKNIRQASYYSLRYMKRRNKQLETFKQTKFIMVKGDITKNHDVQAIVNAANTMLVALKIIFCLGNCRAYNLFLMFLDF